MIGQVYTVPTPSPALEREMASENQVEHLFAPSSRWGEDPHPSKILRTRSAPGQRLGELYRDMREKDTVLGGLLRKRFEAVLELPRRVDPADSSPDALAAADLCRHALAGLHGFGTALKKLLYGRADGVAFAEVTWGRPTRGPLAGAWVPIALVDRPMWRFAFRARALHVRQAGKPPIPAPAGKFIRFTSDTLDQPWGEALLDEGYWYWFIKKHGWKFWSVFVEKWAQPTAMGTYDYVRGESETAQKTNQESQAKLLQILSAMQKEMSIVIPKGIEVALLEAKRSGNDSYGTFIGALDRGLALLVNGEVNTSGMRPGTGAFASDKVAHAISREKVSLDAHDLSASTIRDQLLAPTVHINLGLDAPVPRLVIDTLETEDRQLRMEGLDKVLAAGEPVARRQFYAVHLADEPREGEDVIVRSRPAPAPPPPNDPADDPDDPDQGDPPPTPGPPPSRQTRARAQLRARLQESGDLRDLQALAEQRDAAFDDVAAAFRSPIVDYYNRHRALVEQAWTAGAAGRGEALRFVADRLDPRQLGDSILAAQAHACGLAFSHLIDDGLGADLWDTAARAAGPGTLLDLPLHAPGRGPLLQAPPGFDGATTWSTAVDFWSQLLSIAKSLFAALEDANRRFAFTAAGLEDAAILRDVHEVVQQGITEGLSLQEFRRRLAAVYESHGVTPTSDWHADLILDNNIRQANGVVRYIQIVANPEAHRLIPYLAFNTIGDDRVRDRPGHNHAAMADRIFATGHEIWRTWWYPAGHKCRCLVSLINLARARRMGLVGAEPTGPWPTDRHSGGRALPDVGFRAAPDLGLTVDTDLLPRLQGHVDAAEEGRGRPGGEDLASAIRRVLELLGILLSPGGGL